MAVPTKSPPSRSTSVVRPPARTKTERDGLPPDQFQEVTSKVVDAVLAWRIPIAVGIGGIFALAAGTTLYAGYQSRQNANAAEELAKVMTSVEDNSDALGELGIDLDNVARSPAEVQERNEKLVVAAENLQKVTAAYNGTTSGILAGLERASFLTRAGKNDEAASAYQLMLGEGLSEPEFKFRALNGLGNLLRNEEKYAMAEEQFARCVKELDGVYKQHGLRELGKTYELAKDYTNAAKTLDEYLKQYPDASDKAEVSARLAADRMDGKLVPTELPNASGASTAATTSSGKSENSQPASQAPIDATPSANGNK